ncbi:hypothetical protein GCM10023153_20880 [Ornithinibacter aureus]|uniref:Uncharacterized protein n=1 Tax=Ornithinibacter aureus TaxID=622664 RepID=A0ABP8JWT6_9MICO|nr:hypothetical protein [Ornithinibacter aureus]KAF0834533.1 hypothetical protein C8E84_2364 [Ornithinibacter aureus]
MTDELTLGDLELDDAETFNEESGSDFVDDGLEDTAWEALQDWQPAATFDVLYLVAVLEPQGSPSRLELQTFAYLGCLMSVYKGEPASEWGYAFSAVPPTLPFSPAIEAALSDLVASARLLRTRSEDADEGTNCYRLTAQGRGDLAFLSGLEAFAPRVDFLRAAGKTALFTSPPAVVNSLAYEPQLAQALRLDNPRLLLTQVSSEPLYREFSALVQVLGSEHEELIVPASLYVRYLQQRAQDGVSRALDEADEQ